jgi:hypothetical protein
MTYIRPCKTSKINDDFAAHVRRGSGLPGIDFNCPTGETIWASEDGIVTRAERSAANGINVRIHHADGRNSYYLHLSRLDVTNGQRVSQGQRVGLSGSTGNSTGPHLHFSITNKAGQLVDPAPLLKSGGGSAPAPSLRTIKMGSRGDEVKYLQRKLGISADGIFGPLTRRAVIKFQKSHLLAADGIVGPRTWAVIG